MSYNMMPWDKQLSELDRSIALSHQTILALESSSLAIQSRIMARRAQMARIAGGMEKGLTGEHAHTLQAAIDANAGQLKTISARIQRLNRQTNALHRSRAAAVNAQTRSKNDGKSGK
jgi:predicted  nucleic acid-binding Zn-ribbon protein